MSAFHVFTAPPILMKFCMEIYIQKQINRSVCTSMPDFRNSTPKGSLSRDYWNDDRIILVDCVIYW